MAGSVAEWPDLWPNGRKCGHGRPCPAWPKFGVCGHAYYHIGIAQNWEATLDAHLLSSKQAAGLLEISTRTLRRWSVAFAGSLSEGARRKGRRRAYSSQDVDTFRKAQAMLGQALTIEQVAARLPIIQPGEPTTALTLSPEANLALGQALERTARVSETVSDHDDRLKRLEDWLRLPWYRRMFGRPPTI